MQPLTEQPQYSSQDHPLAIHIGKVLEEKAGKRLPPFVLRLLERIIHQREINDVLYRYGHLDGMDFLEALMGEFAVTTEWYTPSACPSRGAASSSATIRWVVWTAFSLSYMLGKRYGDVRYMVTDFLYYLRPLQSVFLPVNNRQGSQGRESITMLQEAMRSDVPIGTFPAGSCSRIFDGKLQDRPWHKTFVSQAIANERDIVPLHYVGQNSRHFYWIWHIKEALKMKFDPGQALLPDELFRAHGSHFKVIVGGALSPGRACVTAALRLSRRPSVSVR